MEQPAEVVGPDGVSAMRDEWLALAARLDGTSYFQTPDWVLSWWRTVAGQPHVEFALWRARNGALRAVAPLARVEERLHPAVPLAVPLWINAGSGIGGADHCGFVVEPELAVDVAGWVAGRTAGAVELRNLEPDAPYVPMGAAMVGSEVCPRLPLPPPGGEMGRSRNFRQQLRSRRRKVEAAGIAFHSVDAPDIDEALFARLLELHAGRSEQQRWDTSFDDTRLPFHMELAAQGSPGRGPAMVVATREGEVVGIVYGFWWKETFSYFQLGWDERWAEASLGTVLLAQAISYTEAAGGRMFDFLRGAEDFKYRFGAEDHVDRTWLLARGLGGRLLSWKRRQQRRRRG